MATTTPLKISPFMIEWIAPTDSPRKVSKVKKVNDLSLLLSLNKMTR